MFVLVLVVQTKFVHQKPYCARHSLIFNDLLFAILVESECFCTPYTVLPYQIVRSSRNSHLRQSLSAPFNIIVVNRVFYVKRTPLSES